MMFLPTDESDARYALQPWPLPLRLVLERNTDGSISTSYVLPGAALSEKVPPEPFPWQGYDMGLTFDPAKVAFDPRLCAT